MEEIFQGFDIFAEKSIAQQCCSGCSCDLNSEENEGKCILGHLSMLLDIKLSKCGKFIITCDRDEKIRISHYPNAYNIHNFCLGHTDFVTSIALYEDNCLISGSGDGTLRLWNYLLSCCILIYTYFILFKPISKNNQVATDIKVVDIKPRKSAKICKLLLGSI